LRKPKPASRASTNEAQSLNDLRGAVSWLDVSSSEIAASRSS